MIKQNRDKPKFYRGFFCANTCAQTSCVPKQAGGIEYKLFIPSAQSCQCLGTVSGCKVALRVVDYCNLIAALLANIFVRLR